MSNWVLEAQKWWICLERNGELKGKDIEWESWEAQRQYFKIWPLEQSIFLFFSVAERWSIVKWPTRQIVTASLLLFFLSLFWAFYMCCCDILIWIVGFELCSWWFCFFPDSEGFFFRLSYHVTCTWSFIPSCHLVLLRFCSILSSINYSSKVKANKEIINE